MKKMLQYGIISLAVFLSACGGQSTDTAAAGTDTGKYVFCIVGYGQHNPSNGQAQNWGVIGYDVVSEPTNGGAYNSPWLAVQTTTGHKLIFSSQCYYTEDNPKNLDVSWQTR